MSFRQVFVSLGALIALVGCSYGPEHTLVRIENARAQPGTHRFAFSTNFQRVRNPIGFLSTFPDGGSQQIVSREARVYLVDLDKGRIETVARIPDFADIPQPKTVWIQGWRDGSLYFRLFGYGGNKASGDDMADRREVFYRVDPAGKLARIDRLPGNLETESNSGPPPAGKFLRLSTGSTDIGIGVDASPSLADPRVRLVVDPDSGEPRLEFKNQP